MKNPESITSIIPDYFKALEARKVPEGYHIELDEDDEEILVKNEELPYDQMDDLGGD